MAFPWAGSRGEILFAWHFDDVNLLLSSYITGESRIMIRRDIQERVRTIAPFLRLDHDPYLVISDGSCTGYRTPIRRATIFPMHSRRKGSVSTTFAIQ